MILSVKKLLVFLPPFLMTLATVGCAEVMWALGEHSYLAPFAGAATVWAGICAISSTAARAIILDSKGWEHFIPELQQACDKVSCCKTKQRLAACEKALDRADNALLELDVR